MSEKQIKHQELVQQLKEARAKERNLTHQIRNLWLTMTKDEREKLKQLGTSPVDVNVELVRV